METSLTGLKVVAAVLGRSLAGVVGGLMAWGGPGTNWVAGWVGRHVLNGSKRWELRERRMNWGACEDERVEVLMGFLGFMVEDLALLILMDHSPQKRSSPHGSSTCEELLLAVAL